MCSLQSHHDVLSVPLNSTETHDKHSGAKPQALTLFYEGPSADRSTAGFSTFCDNGKNGKNVTEGITTAEMAAVQRVKARQTVFANDCDIDCYCLDRDIRESGRERKSSVDGQDMPAP